MRDASWLLLGLILTTWPLPAAEPRAFAPAASSWKDFVPVITRLTEPRLLGVPIRDANLISYRVCAGYGVDDHDLLCWVTTAESGAHFCALDLGTWQLDIKPLHHLEGYPILPASDGAIYVGSSSGEIWRYRAIGSIWEVLAQPWSTTAARDPHHVRVLAEGRDGWLYGGSCFGERARVNKATGKVRMLPPIREPGDWYVSAAEPLPDGRIVFGLGYAGRVLIFDPALGRDVAEWAPDSWRKDGFILSVLAGPTVLYANHFPSGQRGAFDIGTGKFLGVVPWPEAKMDPSWSSWTQSSGAGSSLDFFLLPGTDTIAACAGGTVHLWNPRDGAHSLPVANFRPDPELARAMRFSVTTDLRVLEYDLRRTRVVRPLEFAQPPAERRLFALGLGPDGRIYGGAFQSTHLFRYDPKNGELSDLGDHNPGWSGETYSFCWRGGELVSASYVNGAIVLYDPSEPWDCAYERQNNPRFVGCLGPFTYRPFACTQDSRGRIWGVGAAGWGLTGGGISWLNPETRETGSVRLPGSPSTLAEVQPGLLVVADDTMVRWWDADANVERAAIPWPFGRAATSVVVPDGQTGKIAFCDVRGLHLARLAAPGKLEIEQSHPLPIDTVRMLWHGGKWIVGGNGIAELDPTNGQWTKISDVGPASVHAFAATADTVYFTRGAQLLAVDRIAK